MPIAVTQVKAPSVPVSRHPSRERSASGRTATASAIPGRTQASVTVRPASMCRRFTQPRTRMIAGNNPQRAAMAAANTIVKPDTTAVASTRPSRADSLMISGILVVPKREVAINVATSRSTLETLSTATVVGGVLSGGDSESDCRCNPKTQQSRRIHNITSRTRSSARTVATLNGNKTASHRCQA